MPTFSKILGAKIAVDAADPGTFDVAGYGALTWADEATDCEIIDFDGFSGTWDTVEDETLCAAGGAPDKGSYTLGEFPINVKYDATNNFHTVIETLRKSASAQGSFRLTLADGKIVYFSARVLADPLKAGDKTASLVSAINLLLTVDYVKSF